MTDEGYIKYRCFWDKTPIKVPESIKAEINLFRDKLIDMGMIGKIVNGPGFGNISVRFNGDEFYISSTNTGHLAALSNKTIALVTSTNIHENSLWCKGLSQSSSEGMTHAPIYKANDSVSAVIHVHHNGLWRSLMGAYPTSSDSIAYGTPEMAKAISEILNSSASRIIVLGGHEDGIISFGGSLQEAFLQIEKEFEIFCEKKLK